MAGGSCFCFLLLLLSIRSILSYNPHATQFTDLKYTVQWLLVFLLSVRPSPQLENIFIPPPPKNSVPSSSCPPCPTSFYETTNNLLSVSADALFGVFCINGLRQYVSFVSIFLYVFRVHPCCGMKSHFIIFYCQRTFHCMDMPHCVYPSIR